MSSDHDIYVHDSREPIEIDVLKKPSIEVEVLGYSGGGTYNYNALHNKPSLNGVTIEGAKQSEDYKLTLSVQDIEKILYLD